MNMKKIVTAIIISVLISACLYYMIPAVCPTEEIAAVLTTKFNLTTCITFGSLTGIVYLLFAYRCKSLMEDEILDKRNEFLLNKCTEDQKLELNKLSGEEKVKYFENIEASLSQSSKNELSNLMFELRTPKAPTALKALSKLALIGLVVYAGYYGYETYQEAKPVIDDYKKYSNATYEDQTLYIDDLPPIVLHGDNEFNQLSINKFIDENIKTQPQFLLDRCKMINIYSSKLWENVKVDDEAIGFSSLENMSINVYQSYDRNYKYTITHELSHIFDFSNATSNSYYGCSDSNEFISLYKKAPNSITEYGKTNSHEFFAEAGMLFVNEPETLKEQNKDVYNYFNELYGPYMNTK